VQQEQFILPEGVTVRDPQGNRYVIEGVLGKGAFGAVYLVRERDAPHTLFALKEVINPNKEDRERFAFEAEVLMRLQHKALPRVHRVFENDKLKRVYLLMDYIEGQNLEVLRAAQPARCFPLPLARVLMAPIVDALIYLHTQEPPIVHRDIKPANIIVPSKSGEAMLADFGSAKEYVPGTATTMIGHRSPGYAALEQYRTGTRPATDVYGLGATLYSLLTGVAPIDAPSRVMESLSSGVDPLQPANLLKPSVPPHIARTLQRAMAIRVDERFDSVEEFWQIFNSEDTQKLPRLSTSALSLAAAPTQAAQGRGEPARDGSLAAPGSRRWVFFSLCIGALVALALGMALYSALRSFTLLLLCCLGALLLAGAALLYLLFSRPRALRQRSLPDTRRR
jgi:eukaryotic-like serine/threonine-protein kinase